MTSWGKASLSGSISNKIISITISSMMEQLFEESISRKT